MLQNLHVKNLALIDEIEVDFRQGLNILTGETGAGKSIILGSIKLALGGRYNRDMIRKNADFALIELLFLIDDPDLEDAFNKMDIFPENHQILLSRKLMEGRSISRINGETVNMSLLRDVATLLMDIHGQHEHETLLHAKTHLAILDDYAKTEISSLKKAAASEFATYKECQKELEKATMDESERQRELSLLQYEIQEIEDASLKLGEDDELEEQYKRMVNGKKILESIQEAYQHTGETDGASDALSRAVRSLSLISEFDLKGKELYEQLIEVDSLLNDFNRELSDYEKRFDYADEEFYEVEERLNQLNHLKSKYGKNTEDILQYYDAQCNRLAELEDYDTYTHKLKQYLKESTEKLEASSRKLSKERIRISKKFIEKIKQSLLELNFLDVQFEMRFEKTMQFTANGFDQAEFYISTNPGEDLHPLSDVASGGELSRIMLAIKTVMADKEETPTLIFDEIDTGISGITAGKVANQMHIIAASHQVICITHLPQIAAISDVHFLIEKNAANQHTQTKIQILDEESSVMELARMIGGESVSEAVLQSARDMKKFSKK